MDTHLAETPTQLLRAEVMEWFGGKDQFIKIHLEMKIYYCDTDVSIED